MWLALLALWSWAEVPTLPPEQILLPPRAPLSVYSFGCWARQTIVALSVVTALAPSRAGRLRRSTSCKTGAAPRRAPDDLWGRLFLLIDRAAHLYGRHAPPPLRRAALRKAERWIVERQERDGSWGGIQPPWVWSIVALRVLGYELDHPVVARALAGLDTFTIDDDDGRRIEACQSPVWDTALALIALLDAGYAAGAPAAGPGRPLARRPGGAHARRLGRAPPRPRPRRLPVRVRQRQLPRRRRHRRRRARAAAQRHRRAAAPPSGASTGCSGCRAARAAGAPSTSTTRAASAPRSPSATSARSPTRRAPTSPRTCSRRSPTSAAPASRAARRGLDWLLARQEADGSWFGRWGANYVYGTGAVLPALAACGLRRPPEHGRRAAASSRACRIRVVDSARTCAPTATAAGAGAASRPPPRRPGRCSACTRPAPATSRPPRRRCASWSRPSARTAAGTSPTTPAPASPATSTSTTTSTATCSR